MKAKEVLDYLQITRPTLTKYVKEGIITVNILPSGRYDYNEESILKFLNKGEERKTCIYIRVAREKEQSIKEQKEILESYCSSNGYSVDETIIDVESDLSKIHSDKFQELLNDIMSNKVQNVIVYSSDRLSKDVSHLNLIQQIMDKHLCKLVTVKNKGTEDLSLENSIRRQLLESTPLIYSIYSENTSKRIKDIFSHERKKLQNKELDLKLVNNILDELEYEILDLFE